MIDSKAKGGRLEASGSAGATAGPPRIDAHDEALLSSIARGDDAALGELYDRFGGAAYRLALRIVRDAGSAEDVVQDAFLSVWRSAPSFDVRRGSARSWLLMLVHHRAVDVVKREQQRAGMRSPLQPQSRELSAADAAASRSERDRIQEALRALPKAEREGLVLAYYAGLSQSQIAEHLSVPLGTVKSRPFSGLRRLRSLVRQESESVLHGVPGQRRSMRTDTGR